MQWPSIWEWRDLPAEATSACLPFYPSVCSSIYSLGIQLCKTAQAQTLSTRIGQQSTQILCGATISARPLEGLGHSLYPRISWIYRWTWPWHLLRLVPWASIEKRRNLLPRSAAATRCLSLARPKGWGEAPQKSQELELLETFGSISNSWKIIGTVNCLNYLIGGFKCLILRRLKQLKKIKQWPKRVKCLRLRSYQQRKYCAASIKALQCKPMGDSMERLVAFRQVANFVHVEIHISIGLLGCRIKNRLTFLWK